MRQFSPVRQRTGKSSGNSYMRYSTILCLLRAICPFKLLSNVVFVQFATIISNNLEKQNNKKTVVYEKFIVGMW